MCGGRVLIVTCSHVGHVFRKHSPYKWPGGGVQRIIRHNKMRTVAVWLDDAHRRFYYTVRRAGGTGSIATARALGLGLSLRQYIPVYRNLSLSHPTSGFRW